MKLHDAIIQVLSQVESTMTTSEIASVLNRMNLYSKKDGSPITSYQIHGRTNNYPHLFEREGSSVKLKTEGIIGQKVQINKKANISQSISISNRELEDGLINDIHFKSASIIDTIVPNSPGMYCIKIKDITLLPKPFQIELKKRNHKIIYIGIASQSLLTRLLNQELRANGHGTFFRSMGATLGFRPLKGSLLNKANKRNYKFSHDDEVKIIQWINENLLVSWVESQDNLESIESELIRKHLPLLNIAKNPAALKILSEVRAECVSMANSK